MAEAALARDKPLTALLLRYRPLLVKTVPERHVTLVVLKLVLSKARKNATVPALISLNAAAVLPQTDHTVFPVTGTNAVKVNWTTWTIIIINVQGKCLTQSNVPEENIFAWYGAALTQALSVLRLKQLEAVSLCISDILTAHAKPRTVKSGVFLIMKIRCFQECSENRPAEESKHMHRP